MTCPFQIGDQIMIVKSYEEMAPTNRNQRLYPGKVGCVERIQASRYAGRSGWSVQCTWEGHGTWTWWVYDDEITRLCDSNVDLDELL